MSHRTDTIIDKIAIALMGETYDDGVTALTGCLGSILKHYPNGDGPERLVTVVKVLKKHILTQDH